MEDIRRARLCTFITTGCEMNIGPRDIQTDVRMNRQCGKEVKDSEGKSEELMYYLGKNYRRLLQIS